ncbi:neuropeptide FF receptor 1-like [Lissotriton helveticus]
MDKTDYDIECRRLLSDTRNYRPLKKDPTEELRNRILTLVKNARDAEHISKQEADYLCTKSAKTPYFYTVPNIHKGVTPPPGRPIVSGIQSLLEPLSRFCDFFLNPLVQQTPSYIKDTKHLLNVIKETNFKPATQLLVGLDIESLYTSLPQDATLKVLHEVLMGTTWNHHTPRSFIMECATLVLKDNYFEYEGKLYLQTNGTSMGSVFAPSIAGLYVAHFKKTYIQTLTNPYTANIKIWRRYIDDILIIWEGSQETLDNFLLWINSCDNYLRFTSWPFDNVMCKMSGLVQGMSVSASVFTLVAIAVERFRCIVYPFRQKLTLRKAIVTIIIIWVLALIIMCPSAVTLTVTRDEYHFMVDDYNNSYPLYSCWEAWPDKEMRKIYTTVLFSHIYLAPLTLIVIMYARIAFKLFKSSAPIRGSQTEENEGRRVSKRKVKVINMLIIVALFFTLSWLPLWTLMLLTDYGKLSDQQLNLIAVYIFPFAHWLAFFNSSVNPIVYGYFNENFRRGFQEAFKVQFCSTKRVHRQTYSESNHHRMVFGVRNRVFVEEMPNESAAPSDAGPSTSTKSGLFSLRSGRVAHHGLVVEDLDNKGCSHNTVSIPAWDI